MIYLPNMRFLSWLLQKLTLGAVLGVLGLTGFGLWSFLHDHVDFDLRSSELVRMLTGETRKIEAALADVNARMAQTRTEQAAQQLRAKEAERLAEELADLNGGLNRLTTDAAQRHENEVRRTHLLHMAAEVKTKVKALEEAATRAQWERDGLEIALGRLHKQIQQAEAEKSKVLHYAREAWTRYGRHVLVLLALYFLGPPLGRAVLYFVVAPFISSRAPVLLGTSRGRPEVRTSEAALDVALAPGDVLWVKEKFLQASDEGLLKQTRWMLDWKMPVTCLTAGLIELIEMRNAAPAVVQRVTFSSQENAHYELAHVTVPAGAGLVLRPRFVAGVIGPVGGRLKIRRHWRLFTLQSWITGQFRYFEFVGPCQLLLAGSRGVRAEVLEPTPGQPAPARRANREVIIGFTPGLAYRPVRAETFWAYLRNQNPLFDDRFEGDGVFLCQATVARDPAQSAASWSTRFWDVALKLFGV